MGSSTQAATRRRTTMIITPYMQRLKRSLAIPISTIQVIDEKCWWVPDSATIKDPARNTGYAVEFEEGKMRCNCQDYNDARRKGLGIPLDEHGHRTCKHIEAVKRYLYEQYELV
jgi:hypothetical protein